MPSFRGKDFEKPAPFQLGSQTLTEPQKLYAATDAWACLNIYNKLQELKRTGDFEIEANNNVVMRCTLSHYHINHIIYIYVQSIP